MRIRAPSDGFSSTLIEISFLISFERESNISPANSQNLSNVISCIPNLIIIILIFILMTPAQAVSQTSSEFPAITEIIIRHGQLAPKQLFLPVQVHFQDDP